MFRAAANSDAEKPEEVIKTLEPERRANVEATITQLAIRRRDITGRGMDQLLQMDESDWQQMVDEANNG